ncbi:MAG: glycoside hydrolase family 9 protein [Saprospiraceae bacterium]
MKYITILLSILYCINVTGQNINSKIDPQVFTTSQSTYDVLLVFDNNTDLSQAINYKSKDGRATYVYNALIKNAKKEQIEVSQFLKSNNIKFRSFYIVNMIAVSADIAMLNKIATLSAVKGIIKDSKLEKSKPIKEDLESLKSVVSTEWGLDMIKAPDVWALGYTGNDVVIGGQDTGYEWEHPALKEKYRGWDGTSANHDYNWHDAIHSADAGNPCGSDSGFPCDDNNHGTHTMGTMVGDDGGTNQIGVAPDAKWMACRNMDEGNGTLSTYTECFEWFLAPYPVGSSSINGDPTKSPHVINNSWACPVSEGCNSSNYDIMELAMNNLRNSGVVIVVSNGNSGNSGCSSTYSPPAFYQNSFSVGATNSSDLMAGFSSRGPIVSDGSNRLKPNVSAPGKQVRSSIIGGGYNTFSGTSMAGPHVAGTVALMISANPNLAGQVEKIETILEQTAVPVSSTQVCGTLSENDIPNNTSGYGRIDALAAVNRAIDLLYVPFIKVDQFGYYNDASKVAVLSDPKIGYNSQDTFTLPSLVHLKDAITHLSVFSAPASPWQSGLTDTLSGDKVWWFDFSAFTTAGTYYVSTNGERSEDFVIGDNVYDDALTAAFNSFYFQRCGAAKIAPYADSPYHDAICHSQDLNCKSIKFPNDSAINRDHSGGWHDAGDYNKYVNYAYGPLIDMLLSYEYNPQAWNDDMNIPESNNGIPDLLDEVKFELDWLLKMQESDGGVNCIVGTLNYAISSPPSTDNADRYYGPKTTSATFTSSAVFALGALQFRKINNPMAQAYATTLEAQAITAYNWAVANPSATYNNLDDNIASSNQEIDSYNISMRKLSSAIYLYALTNDITYKNYAESNYNSAHMIQWTYVYPFEASTQQNLMYFSSLAGVAANVASNIKTVYKVAIENNQENIPSLINNSDAYRAYLKGGDITWGSNKNKCDKGNTYQVYHHYNLDPFNDAVMRTAMDDFVHYMHGVNPNALTYLTNMSDYGADRSCNTIYHGWFEDGSEWDDNRSSLYGPPAGFIPGGPNPGWSLDGCCPSGCGSTNGLCTMMNPPSGQPALKSYNEWNTGWPQNSWSVTENSNTYQGAYLLLLSSRVNTALPIGGDNKLVKIVDTDFEILNQSNGVVLTSPNNTKYKLVVNNTGQLLAIEVNSIGQGSTIVDLASLYVGNQDKGTILRSVNNMLWRLQINPSGQIKVSNAYLAPTLSVIQDTGDILIDDSDQGLILKDKDDNCFLINVDDAGILWVNAVKCGE